MNSIVELTLLAIVVISIIYYEVPPLLQKKQWKELAVFSALLIFGTVLLGLWLVGTEIATPFRALGVL